MYETRGVWGHAPQGKFEFLGECNRIFFSFIGNEERSQVQPCAQKTETVESIAEIIALSALKTSSKLPQNYSLGVTHCRCRINGSIYANGIHGHCQGITLRCALS